MCKFTKIVSFVLRDDNVRCFVVRQFLSQIYAFLRQSEVWVIDCAAKVKMDETAEVTSGADQLSQGDEAVNNYSKQIREEIWANPDWK